MTTKTDAVHVMRVEGKRVYTMAVDFDGTLTLDADAYPHAGKPNWKVIDKVKALKAEGWELILWTCRSGEALENAKKATAEWGIEWDSVNEPTPTQKKWWKGSFGNKVFANVYLDDRACNVNDFFI